MERTPRTVQISEPDQTPTPRPLWRLAFRAGFLAAGLFAVLGTARWLAWMLWPAQWDYRIFPNWWHAHEMLYGFAMPVVAGFLLTAVATWTGTRGTSGWRLQVLFALWLIARLVLWLVPEHMLIALAAESLFIGLLAWELGKRVWAARQSRNMLFLPVLAAIGLFNAASYYTVDNPLFATQLHYGTVWLITVLIVIIGGRVIPLFTGNRLGEKISPLPAWFENLALATTILIAIFSVLDITPEFRLALPPLYIVGSIIHGLRLLHWRGWRTGRVPLLWSMHLSYLCIPAAMLGLSMASDNPANVKNLIHLLAVGSVGGMILAMMSRVSLGHTGRPLEVPTYIACAFALVFIAALVRALLPLLDAGLVHWSWRLSAILWIIAFTLFLWHYFPILTRARVDGKPG